MNNYKMFLEVQGSKKQGNDPNWLLNTGGEARIRKSLWITFSAGSEFNGDNKNWNLVTNFGLKLGLPNKYTSDSYLVVIK